MQNSSEPMFQYIFSCSNLHFFWQMMQYSPKPMFRYFHAQICIFLANDTEQYRDHISILPGSNLYFSDKWCSIALSLCSDISMIKPAFFWQMMQRAQSLYFNINMPKPAFFWQMVQNSFEPMFQYILSRSNLHLSDKWYRIARSLCFNITSIKLAFFCQIMQSSSESMFRYFHAQNCSFLANDTE